MSEPTDLIAGKKPGDKHAYTNSYACDIIENEGLDYAVRHYTSADVFADATTRSLWASCARELDALITHLRQSGCALEA